MSVIFTLEGYSALAPTCIVKILSGNKLPRKGGNWSIGNEIPPSDLYCYLYSKFGLPNGIQNIFRDDTSDNLIHWDWTLVNEKGLITILGLNLRTEIHLIGDYDFANYSRDQFISYIQKDMQNYQKEISSFKKNTLESWDVFVNPYLSLKNAIEQLFYDLSNLCIDPTKEQLGNPNAISDITELSKKWSSLMGKYHRGVGISIALKIMIPILAESFINLIIFILCRPDIQQNKRLFDSTMRSNIDVRIQSLHINCIGFKNAINWQAPQCKKYNTIVNQRNDLLHGNINIEKLKVFDIYFNDKVPVFKQYHSIWQQSIGVSLEASGFSEVKEDYKIVEDFIEYVLSCIHSKYQKEIEVFINKRDIGFNKKTKRLGILLPDKIVDFHLSSID